jgi:hypothetical protein
MLIQARQDLPVRNLLNLGWRLQPGPRTSDFSFWFPGGGGLVRLSLLGTSMIDDECGAVGGMRICRESRSTRRKPLPVPLCQPQIPHELTWDRTRSATVGSRRLTIWAMAQLNQWLCRRQMIIRNCKLQGLHSLVMSTCSPNNHARQTRQLWKLILNFLDIVILKNNGYGRSAWVHSTPVTAVRSINSMMTPVKQASWGRVCWRIWKDEEYLRSRIIFGFKTLCLSRRRPEAFVSVWTNGG